MTELVTKHSSPGGINAFLNWQQVGLAYTQPTEAFLSSANMALVATHHVPRGAVLSSFSGHHYTAKMG